MTPKIEELKAAYEAANMKAKESYAVYLSLKKIAHDASEEYRDALDAHLNSICPIPVDADVVAQKPRKEHEKYCFMGYRHGIPKIHRLTKNGKIAGNVKSEAVDEFLYISYNGKMYKDNYGFNKELVEVQP